MTKTLTCSIQDSEDTALISLTGTIDPVKFNPNITIQIEGFKISCDSQKLAEALKEVVDFQTSGIKTIYVQAESGVTLEDTNNA